MAVDASHPIGVHRSAGEVLQSAVRRVEARLEKTQWGLGLRGQSVRDSLRALERALLALLEDPESTDLAAADCSSPLRDPLLGAMMTELLAAPADPRSAPAILRAVRAVTALRSAGVGPGEDGSQPSEALEDLLGGPNAFELLVEVAHDFRSPLTSILFLAETLRDGNSGPVSDLQRSQLGLIYSAAFGLASVASDVMDLAHRGEDLMHEDASPFALAEVFRSVERLVNPIVQEKGLALHVVAPEHARARGHPHALSRVLLNLATNALKFTDEGFVEMGVRRLPKARLEFYVQDTGRGIPPARQAELFMPFKPRRGQAREGHFFSGSGVGLSIARRLVRAMGSELTLETSDASGTRFSFVISDMPSR